MQLIEWIPTANATLNLLSLLALSAGLYFIKHGRRDLHQRAMLTAFALSVLFLVLYLIRWSQTGPTPYLGPFRPLYFAILWTHTPLAALTPVLAILTLRRALRQEFAQHKRLARVTFPIWIYVSLTGLIIYGMLHYLR
ncbi:MAG: DUF420 domain-containing protein [Candidatus Bipolaricaulota bacterium]|nr:DUF420 domain-containing protein [Candidatus Bipolaricaulota bacterium]MCS7275351.1 DUF420 domain-containing protein [Candidatus Bipolaricaulota bacterium]MDW8110150.1 DUF420 domain-containing protein [Candidatus Bipolaricaulota bacterium]MDW8329182.1 DUF420 domain-containing protein [Candidatus Bipolaricaulota bacterium]